jgi:hypothetical protein
MMIATFGINKHLLAYYALSGLTIAWVLLVTGLHPVLTDYALSGQKTPTRIKMNLLEKHL